MSLKCMRTSSTTWLDKPEAGVVHGQQDAFDGQVRIQSALHNFDCVEQLAQSFQSEVLALHRE